MLPTSSARDKGGGRSTISIHPIQGGGRKEGGSREGKGRRGTGPYACINAKRQRQQQLFATKKKGNIVNI